MEYIKMNGLAYPQIDRHVEQIGDYSCADAGIEVIIFADCAAIYELSRRYETGYDEEQGDFVRNYEEPSLRRLCTLSELKTSVSLLNLIEE